MRHSTAICLVVLGCVASAAGQSAFVYDQQSKPAGSSSAAGVSETCYLSCPGRLLGHEDPCSALY